MGVRLRISLPLRVNLNSFFERWVTVDLRKNLEVGFQIQDVITLSLPPETIQ